VRACAALRAGRDEDALAACDAALQLVDACSRPVPSSDRAHLHYNKAQAAYRLSRHTVAIEGCLAAVSLDPGHVRALALRADVHLDLMEYEDAKLDYARLAELDPRDPTWAEKARDADRKSSSTHYQTLGVPLIADANDVKRAFREQCKKWHPDRQQHGQSAEDQRRATTQFKRINEAYQVSGRDPHSRDTVQAHQ
jgi:tetratricopeptide (TPR) repeat protein